MKNESKIIKCSAGNCDRLAKTLGYCSAQQVHYKNGQRNDNTPNTLELWSKNQPVGGRVEDLIIWAKEIIALYGDNENQY